MREQGALVEEAAEDDEAADGEGDEKTLGLDLGPPAEGQPASFDEKAALHHVHFAPGTHGEGESDAETVDIDVAPESDAPHRTQSGEGPYDVEP